jgi:hypothetical protein
VAMSDISGSFRSDSSRPSKCKPSTLEISNACQGWRSCLRPHLNWCCVRNTSICFKFTNWLYVVQL